MYQVTLSNNGKDTVINAIAVDNDAPRLLTGIIKKAINVADNFTFTISANEKGYSKISPLTTLVEILNTKTNLIDFKGRVVLPVESMDSDGAMIKTVTCESELAYLMDTNTRYGLYKNMTAKAFLTIIINNHNSLVNVDKQFTLGTVNVLDIATESASRSLDYDKTLDVIKDKLIAALGGELQVRTVNGIRYLDYLVAIGETKKTEIRLSRNLITIQQEKDPTTVISRLMPLGAKGTTDKRLDITTVNNKLDYLDDATAIAEFGIISDSFTWDDITTASALLTAGKLKLVEVNKMLVKYEISALDLSIINLDADQFTVGNSYPLINQLMSIDDTLRVLETTTDINAPHNSALTIGDKFEDIKAYQLNSIKANKNIEKMNGTVNSNVKAISTITGETATTNNNVAQLKILSMMGV